EILNKEKFLIITGPPGIGKTTLSYIITYQYLAKDFKLVYVDNSISEAESIFSLSTEARQIILFDDFLGSFIPELFSSSREKKLINFIEKVKNSHNKYMILTSRTVFFNEAMQIYEKFHQAQIDLAKYELSISHYSDLEKAKILYKHLHFSSMPIEYKNEFIKDKRYLSVIRHRNYTPRLIEYFTKPSNLNSFKPELYIKHFVIKNLNDPKELWKYHYDVHIDDECRMLVDWIFLLGDGASQDHVEAAYEKRLSYELSKRNLIPKHNSLSRAIKTLQDGFIKTRRSASSSGTVIYDLLNPSLGDFLIKHFNETKDLEVKKSLMYSVVTFSQVTRRFHSSDSDYIILNRDEYLLF
ncbi:restriction endonuclease, partial [Leptospira interrogans serovar Ricardi]|uniref:ATP-binding protein n=1 Tax=Leptospira interrogans TaxID=173 RepID=UPI0021595D02